MKTAVIIARFQSPYLHNGHKALIDKVRAVHDRLIIVLGVAPVAGSQKNPFDYCTREKMLKKSYPDVIVLPLSDQPDDHLWSIQLDQLLATTFPTEQFLLFGSRDSFIPYYSGRYETVELLEHGNYSATELRKQFAGKALNSEDFRAGVIYAYHNQYPKVYATADIAVFRNNKTELLLARKPNESRWRFTGGFSDPEDKSFEESARRELTEECGSIEVGEMRYETSSRIDDWRYRNEIDKIITTLFSCDHLYGIPEPNDDIQELRWFHLADIPAMIESGEISKEHQHLFEMLIRKYNKVETLKITSYEKE